MFRKLFEALRIVEPTPEYSEKRLMHAPKIYEPLPLDLIPGPILLSLGMYQGASQASLLEVGMGKTLWRSGYSESSWDESTYNDPDDDEPDNDYDDYDEQDDDDLNNAMMDDLLFGEW